MVIYATEFVLWCGVFACGGYFNFVPWARQKLSARAEVKKDERNAAAPAVEATGAIGLSTNLSLTQLPSSTSVFRTPSSVATERGSVRSLGRTAA